MQVLSLILARGGSKALPGKNVVPLGGKPLIAWTIEAALASDVVTRTVVTTDDADIAETAKMYGAEVPFLRPRELAEDGTPGILPVLQAVRQLERDETYRPDIVVTLQPTSPLRTADDIDAAVALLIERNADSVISVTAAKNHPFWLKTVDADGWAHDFVKQAKPVTTRQALPPVYALNGAIYVASRATLLAKGGWETPRTAAYIMPFERSIDIDTAQDLALAELLLRAVVG
jgi:CMP-N-acetylneuraminic acid synthetase